MTSVYGKIQNLITAANTVTGESDTTLTDAVQTLVDGYGQGGGYTATEVVSRAAPAGAVVVSGVTSIDDYALYGRNSMTAFTGSDVTTVKKSAFEWCEYITTVNLPVCTSVGNNAFSSAKRLVSCSIPNATTIGDGCFNGCSALQSINLASATTIGSGAFRNASAGGLIASPITLNDSAFRDTSNMNIGFFPRLTTINGSYALAGTYNVSKGSTVTAFVAPALTTVSNNRDFLSFNSALVAVDLGSPSRLHNTSFDSNTAMETLILRTSTVTPLNNINAFNNTPFASGKTGGTLYVPSALISSYQSASNWSTILGYADNSIQAIEGSYYETHYADGTVIE